ncbi:MAG: alpha-amylase [Peptostreptococcaceae bacterium]|nr:alpha-amylase [Peptostreptococcaceae bacterium]
MNGLLLQAFEWYLPDDGKHYLRLQESLPYLKELGFTALWLPPVCKGTGSSDVGYGIYDLYDLGEFDQKGTVRTKYGTKDELKALIGAAHEAGISIYADVVLNHKAGADETEVFQATEVSWENRDDEVSEEREIRGWTKFTFPGRNKKYSDFQWNHHHFSGVDWDEIEQKRAIFRISGFNKGWSFSVSDEKGNFDYLMNANIDHSNEEVRTELFRWVKWFIEELDLDGFRLDAVKHIDSGFMDELTKHILNEIRKDFYFVAEYWLNDPAALQDYLTDTSANIDLFDVGLHFSLYCASKAGKDYDLRRIFDDSIVRSDRTLSVTFVDNHDSQPGQSLESWVEDWFRPIAYALILLRKDGYPTIFYGDLFGIGDGSLYAGMGEPLKKLIELRRNYAYGEQEDHFEDPHLIGFIRHGDEGHPGKLITLISNGEGGSLRLFVGEELKGRCFFDYLGHHEEVLTIGEDGFCEFPVRAASVSCWIEKREV